jgi:HPt (histidine-containing phosphotransfer) domain-containing protein
LGGDEFVLKMIEVFLSYGAQKIAETRQALEASDLTGVAKAAHPIKSSAGNVGALEVQDLATRIEALASQSQCNSLAALVLELEQAFEKVRVELGSKSQVTNND